MQAGQIPFDARPHRVVHILFFTIAMAHSHLITAILFFLQGGNYLLLPFKGAVQGGYLLLLLLYGLD